MKTKNKKQLIISAVVVALLVVFDQLTKYLAVKFLKGKAAIPIIKDIFELQYLENTSAAFGMDPISLLHNIFSFQIFNENPVFFLNTRMIFFVILTLVMLGLFFVVYTRIPNEKKYKYIDYVLIFLSAGAIGNFIDRASQQYVIDFLYFKLINFPIFNVADIYVTCSCVAMLVLGLFYYKDEDFDKIFPNKNKK